MAMGPRKIDTINEKLSAFKAALAAGLAPAVVESGHTPYTNRRDADLKARWYINLVWDAEGDYLGALGGAAREGTVKAILICHHRVADDASRDELQTAEIAMAEQIKTLVRTGVAGMTVVLDTIQGSRLLEHPYGWLVAYLELQPPKQSTH